MLNTFQQLRHPVLPEQTLDESARQEFSKSFRQFIQQKLLPGLGNVYQKALGDFEREHGRAPKNRREVRRFMVEQPYFQTYASSNRIAQELLWESVVTAIDRQLPELNRRVAEYSRQNAAKLHVDPAFNVPKYISSVDIHCMPGGYAGEVSEDDVSTAALYDRGVFLYAMGYAGPLNDDMGRSVCNYIQRSLEGFKPKKILDMGCTVGHSTIPFKETFADADVIGIDVAAPQLRYAHARAGALGTEIGFEQRDAAATGFEAESFDLVVSHIMLHETSGKAMPQIFKECFRLLKPGGYMIHADLPPFDHSNLFSEFILDNETYYNNEPFWGAMRDIDQIQLACDAGFDRADVKFDTAPMAIMEYAQAGEKGYADDAATEVADREFNSGEFAPGGGWEVLIGHKK